MRVEDAIVENTRKVVFGSMLLRPFRSLAGAHEVLYKGPSIKYVTLTGVGGCPGKCYYALRGGRVYLGDRYVHYLKSLFCSSGCQYQTDCIDCYTSLWDVFQLNSN